MKVLIEIDEHNKNVIDRFADGEGCDILPENIFTDLIESVKNGTPVPDIATNREYVIVSFEHSGQSDLAFWGSLTDDKEKRSFSGYTFDLDSCERYTQDEIIEADNPALFYQGESLYELMESYLDVAIKVDDLLSIVGLKTQRVVYVV